VAWVIGSVVVSEGRGDPVGAGGGREPLLREHRLVLGQRWRWSCARASATGLVVGDEGVGGALLRFLEVRPRRPAASAAHRSAELAGERLAAVRTVWPRSALAPS
jgi:hypothetical protein